MNNQLIVIIGAGPGVSAGIARKFGSNDFSVILLARRQKSLDAQITELRNTKIQAHAIVADCSDAESLTGAFQLIEKEYGTPNVVVYNAGANSISDPSVLEVKNLLSDFVVNVAGALTSAQLAIPAMTKRGSGSILFTGGMLALRPVPSRASASISKAGLRNLVFTLADELEPAGITVGIVTIGGVVAPGTYYDPDLIAEEYWRLYAGEGHTEIVYQQE